MRVDNIYLNLKKLGYECDIRGTDVICYIGYMADIDQGDCISPAVRFDELKLELIRWASGHNTAGKRQGSKFVIFGEKAKKADDIEFDLLNYAAGSLNLDKTNYNQNQKNLFLEFDQKCSNLPCDSEGPTHQQELDMDNLTKHFVDLILMAGIEFKRNNAKEKLEKLLDYNFLEKLEILTHVSKVYNYLWISPDGEIGLSEEVSNNIYHPNLIIPWKNYLSGPCSCDWCSEWDNNLNNVQNDFENKEEFLKACINNNTECLENLEKQILENFNEIPKAFFYDEK